MSCRGLLRTGGAAIILAGCCAAATMAQTYTADPGTWRPVAYSDLTFPRGEAESYASLWQDRLDESNKKAEPSNPGVPLNTSIAVGNRGASEWHFSINFQTKVVALSVLSTPHLCTDEYPSPTKGIRIKICPSRLATFENNSYSVIDGAACFVEKESGTPVEDSTATVTYAAYDIPTRAIRLRYIVSHQEIDRCAQSVALHPENATR
jgi:hypothetical protein